MLVKDDGVDVLTNRVQSYSSVPEELHFHVYIHVCLVSSVRNA
jgi:hypothetical protein